MFEKNTPFLKFEFWIFSWLIDLFIFEILFDLFKKENCEIFEYLNFAFWIISDFDNLYLNFFGKFCAIFFSKS